MQYLGAIKSFTLKFKVQQDVWVALVVTMYKQNKKKSLTQAQLIAGPYRVAYVHQLQTFFKVFPWGKNLRRI